MMNHERSDFLADEVRAVDLSGWADILPARFSVLGGNLFADIFLADETGAVHMLEVSAASIAKIAASEDEFRQRCIGDEDGWLLRSLVDQCRSAGMNPSDTQCYAFTTPPCSAESISPTTSGYAHGANGSATRHRSTGRPKVCQTAPQCRSRLLTEGFALRRRRNRRPLGNGRPRG